MTKLLEMTFSDSTQVDKQAGIIRGVKILGRASRNGREYSPAAMRDAAKIYEGLGVNLNHPDRKGTLVDRPVQDGFGWLESVRIEPDGVYGDLHYLKSHPQASVIAEAAERNPRRFGLSHNAEGRLSKQAGKLVVESIVSVQSVDIVQNPATNRGLFESEEPLQKTVKQILEGHGEKLARLFEDDAFLPLADTPVDVADGANDDEQRNAALRALILAVLNDDALSFDDKLAGVQDIIDAQSDRTFAAANAAAESSLNRQSTDPTVAQLQEELQILRAENQARELLDAASVIADSIRIKAVAALPAVERVALVESFPKRASGAARPPRSAPLYESDHASLTEFPKDTKAFVAALR